MRDIQVFLGFANFYGQFIQSFGKITMILTLILKTIIIYQNIDNDSKYINNQKVDMQKKKKSKRNNNPNKIDLFF